VSALVTYKIITREFLDPVLKQARTTYETQKIQVAQERLKQYAALETEKIQLQRGNLRRYDDLNFYGTLGMLAASGVALLILAAGYSRAKVKQASVYLAHIGQHSVIPVRMEDLQHFYPIAANLSLAEIESSVSTAHDNAYRISRQMLEDMTEYTRSLAGKRGLNALTTSDPDQNQFGSPALLSTPTFAELLSDGTIAPGKPLVLGYDRQGQPQYRTLQDLKSLAIAGWQGSGKTLSTGYMVASSIFVYSVHAYIVDPHKQHQESLSTLLKPLESTGHITIINPFDTQTLLDNLNSILDRRLDGQEANEPGILLVIDELARLAKMACFDQLVTFLERCTEETRKANITFIGGSPKWTARYFKGRADIRGCMNSMLIHKTKPSQAELLIEDAHDKNLVKHLNRPGDAILVTDYATPTLVSMPRCNRKDMETVAHLMKESCKTVASNTARMVVVGDDHGRYEIAFRKSQEPTPGPHSTSAFSPELVEGSGQASQEGKTSEVISFAEHRKEHKATPQTVFDPQQLTAEMIQEQFQQRKAHDANFTQAELARQVGISAGHLSKILSGQRPLTDAHKQKFYAILFDNPHQTPISSPWFSTLKKAVHL
jgi:hypothetical protein